MKVDAQKFKELLRLLIKNDMNLNLVVEKNKAYVRAVDKSEFAEIEFKLTHSKKELSIKEGKYVYNPDLIMSYLDSISTQVLDIRVKPASNSIEIKTDDYVIRVAPMA